MRFKRWDSSQQLHPKFKSLPPLFEWLLFVATSNLKKITMVSVTRFFVAKMRDSEISEFKKFGNHAPRKCDSIGNLYASFRLSFSFNEAGFHPRKKGVTRICVFSGISKDSIKVHRVLL